MNKEYLVALGLAGTGFATFTLLLVFDHVGSVSYLALLSLLALICLVLPVHSRLKELDVKNLKLTLDKIETVKDEIYAKEESLQEAAYLLADVIAVNSTLSGMIGDEESFEYASKLVHNRLKKLGRNLNISSEKLDELFKFERALKDLQKYKGEERDEKWNEFMGLLKREANK